MTINRLPVSASVTKYHTLKFLSHRSQLFTEMVNTGILGLATHTEYHVPIGHLGHPLSSLVTRLD